jgi:hypothetical protein
VVKKSEETRETIIPLSLEIGQWWLHEERIINYNKTNKENYLQN